MRDEQNTGWPEAKDFTHKTNEKRLEFFRQRTDAACKELLADKLILACILKSCIPEFKKCTVQEIETQYIEGDPEISTVGVLPGTTNATNVNAADNTEANAGAPGKIRGLNTESTSDTEGRITFDILFYALTPSNDRLKLVINVEAQNEFYPGYPLMKRALYYVSRLISAQYGVEFDHAHYENIQKVCSIWICFDPPKNRRNTITLYHIIEQNILGEAHEQPENYDLMSAVMVCLGTKKDAHYEGLPKFLDVWVSQSENLDKKAEVLKTEFDAELPKRFTERGETMCNFSDFIEERGRRRGMEEGIQQGRLEGLLNLMNKLNMTADQALDTLSIPEEEWDDYRERIREFETKKCSEN